MRLISPGLPSNSLMLWKRLTMMLGKYAFRHGSISGMKAADMCSVRELRQCPLSIQEHGECGFIISDFYPWGSLLDTMKSFSSIQFWEPKLLVQQCVRILENIASGLNFLHFGKCTYLLIVLLVWKCFGKPGQLFNSLTLQRADSDAVTFCIFPAKIKVH